MSKIVEVHRKIRRAVQAPLAAAAEAAVPEVPIQWKGIEFTREGKDFFISVDVGMGEVIVHEIGPNPLMEGPGYVTCVLHSPIRAGEDANDKLLPVITAAYPYGAVLTFDGVSVNIDKMQHRGYGSDGPWLTGLVSVDWTIFRR